MLPDETDERLLRVAAGDRDALAQVLRELEPRLVRMVDLRLEPALRRRVEPRDVVQDALLEATRRFDEWLAASTYPLHVWLRLLTGQALVVARRTHLGTQKRDAARERGAADERPNVSTASVAEFFAASQTSPSQAATREEARAIVLGALDELDELDREVLVLRQFEELSNEEAAAELGIEPAAASKRFSRALQRLRPALRALEPRG
ncbi:MAG: sigma-70 family RNA polymerase sigma factor [Planctomycetes bacterium]|nr:sigma-70 family RNA polymerase sigma factor [Planctomycetota bacterium]